MPLEFLESLLRCNHHQPLLPHPSRLAVQSCTIRSSIEATRHHAAVLQQHPEVYSFPKIARSRISLSTRGTVYNLSSSPSMSTRDTNSVKH